MAEPDTISPEVLACRLYGQGDLRIEPVPLGLPGAGEVLVRIGAGGICGSDLHYYQDGRIGEMVLREPLVLGHEVAGTVEQVGHGVDSLAPGARVAVNPATPCGECRYCRDGQAQHCLRMSFYGSAARFPHVQGAFLEKLVVGADNCVPISPGTSLVEAACAEPLAVCLHARAQAPDLAGKAVLVTGAGPIGALCAAVAREAGAAEVAVTDIQDYPLSVARRMGASHTLNVASDTEAAASWAQYKGRFDVTFECSAAPAALALAVTTTRPRGTLVQVGVTGELPLPINTLVTKELRLVGSYRFHHEYPEAVRMIDVGELDVSPMISARFPLAEAEAAFEAAGDRSKAVKVMLLPNAGNDPTPG